MPQQTRPVRWYDLAFAWIIAAVFLISAIWGTVDGLGEMPLAGLRRVSADPSIAWPLALFVLYASIQLSVARFRIRGPLLLTSGALACAWAVMALYVTPGPALGLAFLSVLFYRQAKAAEA